MTGVSRFLVADSARFIPTNGDSRVYAHGTADAKEPGMNANEMVGSYGVVFYRGHWRACRVEVEHRVNCIVSLLDDCTEIRVSKDRVRA